MKKNINLKPVGDFLVGVCKAAAFGLMLSAPRALEINVGKRYDSSERYTYGGAVEAIMEENMFASDKRKLVEVIKRDGDCEYYRSVIKIVESSMFSSDKLKLIKSINE